MLVSQRPISATTAISVFGRRHRWSVIFPTRIAHPSDIFLLHTNFLFIATTIQLFKMNFIRNDPVRQGRVDFNGKTAFFVFHTTAPSRADWEELSRRTNPVSATHFHLLPFSLAAVRENFVPSSSVIAIALDGYLRAGGDGVSSTLFGARRKDKIRSRRGIAHFAWDIQFGREEPGKQKYVALVRDALTRSRQEKRDLGEEEGSSAERLDNRGFGDAEDQKEQDEDEDFRSAEEDLAPFDAEEGRSDSGDAEEMEDIVEDTGSKTSEASNQSSVEREDAWGSVEDNPSSFDEEQEPVGIGEDESMDDVVGGAAPELDEAPEEIAADKPESRDLSDEDWEACKVVMRGGRGRKDKAPPDDRRSLNGVLYWLRSGCEWKYLPERFGKWNTVYRRFQRWQENGIWEEIEVCLRERGLDKDWQPDRPQIKRRQSSEPPVPAAVANVTDLLATLQQSCGDSGTDLTRNLLLLLAKGLGEGTANG
ncbi:transposase [Rhizobium sp. BT-226]|uniref:transposase n=1 Tax=Rhizobium sp. BT-226 TaxID=2986922 RepID=UPI0035562BD9